MEIERAPGCIYMYDCFPIIAIKCHVLVGRILNCLDFNKKRVQTLL